MLVRPGLRKLHGLSVTEVETILTGIAQYAIVWVPVAGPSAPEAADQLLWDLFAGKADLQRVTGDKMLLKDPGMRGRVMSRREFAEVVWPN